MYNTRAQQTGAAQQQQSIKHIHNAAAHNVLLLDQLLFSLQEPAASVVAQRGQSAKTAVAASQAHHGRHRHRVSSMPANWHTTSL
jgi:hypothetical protein